MPPDAVPRFVLPQGACDTHAHVIAASGYPLDPGRLYDPEPASEAAYLSMLDRFGFTYGVLVQVSVYGTDNRFLIDVLQRHPKRLRGVAVVDPEIDDKTLARLRKVGVRGVRVNALYGGATRLAALSTLAARVAEFGLHIQLYADGETLQRHSEMLSGLPCPLVLDHIGHSQASEGIDDAGFQTVLRLAAMPHVWVKLSGANRLGTPPGFSDTIDFARALVDVSPDRLVWGSDWPHVACDPVRTDDLFDLLPQWVPNAGARDRILVTNPARLYGFEPVLTEGQVAG
ncbi:amidohydrolase family protein (plasmid) [Paraburkholderia sp. PREW-6R]|uniref:amidohydrolase family protein n=1 Tax=Paraburkholderia sp. PREW-6R TaxID=3141544 RepID=UPI0031F52CF1